MSEQRLEDYLGHVLDAISRIQEYAEGLEKAEFLSDKRTQDAVIRNLEVIGEASRRIQTRHPEFVAAHPELPLSSAYQMRNAVAHGYFEVDLDVVWNTVENDLPALAEIVGRVVADET